MEGSAHAQMYALLRYYYRDPDIHKRPQAEVLRLYAELQWVREEEAKVRAHLPDAS